MSDTLYSFEFKFTAAGPSAVPPRKVPPTASEALNKAVEEAKDVLTAHGFTVVHDGYGVRYLEEVAPGDQARLDQFRAQQKHDAMDAADSVAHAVSDLTELDPVGCKPRDDGWVVEGYRDGEIAVRIVLDARGRLVGAWDPDSVVDVLSENGVL